MKNLLICLLTSLTLMMTMNTDAAAAADAGAADAPAKKGRGKLVHVVSFKFKDTAGAEGIRKVEEAFAALPGKIAQIATYETGTNVSPEKLDKGFTHAWVLTFHSAKDRDDYLVHPDHQAFGKLVGPHVADVFVIDFWAQKAGRAKAAGKGKGKAKP
jgi:hypothetical protein